MKKILSILVGLTLAASVYAGGNHHNNPGGQPNNPGGQYDRPSGGNTGDCDNTQKVPDGGTTLVLLGAGLAATALVRRRIRS